MSFCLPKYSVECSSTVRVCAGSCLNFRISLNGFSKSSNLPYVMVIDCSSHSFSRVKVPLGVTTIPVFIYTAIKVKSKRGRKKNIRQANDFSFGQHRYNTQHHLQPWRNNQRNNREHHHRRYAMQYISYIPKYTSNQPLKNDFAQSFSLAIIIQKNALIFTRSAKKKVQNGLFYHFIYKILVINRSNMLHRQVHPYG